MTEAFDFSWLGHGGIILLIAATLVRSEGHRDLLIGAASLCGIATSVIVIERPSYAMLFALVIVALLVKSAVRAMRLASVQFSPEDRQLRDSHFAKMDDGLARRLIDEGHWISSEKGDVLIEEAHAAPCLFFLATGTATVSRNGVDVGRCDSGDLIGEATVVDGGSASGTVRLASAARLWFVPAERLRSFLAANPAAQAALTAVFAKALRSKLSDANARAAQNAADIGEEP